MDVGSTSSTTWPRIGWNPAAALAHVPSGLSLGTLSLAALVLAARRVSGGLQEPLPTLSLLLLGCVLLALALLSVRSAVSWLVRRERAYAWLASLVSTWLVVITLSISLPD